MDTMEPVVGRSSGCPNTVYIVELREWQWSERLGRYAQENTQMAVASTYDKAIEYIKREAAEPSPPTNNVYWYWIFEDEIDNFDICSSIKGRTMVDKNGGLLDCSPDLPLEHRDFTCPSCNTSFEDDGKEHPYGIMCPACPGPLKGVIHPR